VEGNDAKTVRTDLDYKAMFAATPSPYLVLSPDLVIVDVNDAYLRATGWSGQDMVGLHLFDAFPGNPQDATADGVRNLDASLHRVLQSRRPDTMAVQKYDIPVAHRPGAFEERWWSPINTPVLGRDGRVAWIIHRVEDVTDFIRSRMTGPEGPLGKREAMEAELYARSRELQRLNEELRQAHSRERQIAIALQGVMLHSPDLERHGDVEVRYLPAVGSLNVCGDWYDVVDLPDACFGVAVGDVVGHAGGRAPAISPTRC
jgi:PAS domain S-box-containing protein